MASALESKAEKEAGTAAKRMRLAAATIGDQEISGVSLQVESSSEWWNCTPSVYGLSLSPSSFERENTGRNFGGGILGS
jgi:hypothetical protein